MDDTQPIRDDVPFDPDQTWKTDVVDADATWPNPDRRSSGEQPNPPADDLRA